MTNAIDLLEVHKACVLNALDSYPKVIHDFVDEAAFKGWWFEYVEVGLDLTTEQLDQIFRELKEQVYTFESCLSEYRRILTGNPGKALLLDDYNYAYIADRGELMCLRRINEEGIAEVVPFNSNDFNRSHGGWFGETYLETLSHINAAVLIDVTSQF
ncbi:TPA: hypothetical protein ACVGJS_003613 [Pseudomonas aeruginosa]